MIRDGAVEGEMFHQLPVELRQEILSYIVPAGHRQSITLYLVEYPYSHKRAKFRYGKHNTSAEKFVYVFRVNRQWLQDAVEIFYGSREFFLEYGLRYQFEQSASDGPSKPVRDALRTDSLSVFPGYALKAIKRLHILIRDELTDAATRRRVKKALGVFAEKLEDGHSLTRLTVDVSNVERFWDVYKLVNASCYKHRFEAPLPEQDATKCGCILEPLSRLHSIKEVTINGTNPDFDERLERLLKAQDRTQPDLKRRSENKVAKQIRHNRVKKHPRRSWQKSHKSRYNGTNVSEV